MELNLGKDCSLVRWQSLRRGGNILRRAEKSCWWRRFWATTDC